MKTVFDGHPHLISANTRVFDRMTSQPINKQCRFGKTDMDAEYTFFSPRRAARNRWDGILRIDSE
ncbi:MAG: hypothetical protein IPJ06_13490 [Saprospiraceae bacterium]|nr:hypothetical protein [Saprospiraceae bacterium]